MRTAKRAGKWARDGERSGILDVARFECKGGVSRRQVGGVCTLHWHGGVKMRCSSSCTASSA